MSSLLCSRNKQAEVALKPCVVAVLAQALKPYADQDKLYWLKRSPLTQRLLNLRNNQDICVSRRDQKDDDYLNSDTTCIASPPQMKKRKEKESSSPLAENHSLFMEPLKKNPSLCPPVGILFVQTPRADATCSCLPEETQTLKKNHADVTSFCLPKKTRIQKKKHADAISFSRPEETRIFNPISKGRGAKLRSFIFKSLATMMILFLSPVLCQQASLLPSGQTRGVVGYNASFTCISRRSNENSIQWIINGSNATYTPNAVAVEHDPGVGTLDFISLTLLNDASIILCVSYDITTSQKTVSNEVTLLVSEGQLGPVRFLEVMLHKFTLFVTWTPPPVIGILDHDPNMTTYCVEVDSSSSSSAVHSECGVNETIFMYPLPPRSWCQRLTFIITPRNGASRGSSRARSFFMTDSRPQVMTVVVQPVTVWIVMTAPVCTGDLSLVDIDTGETITLGNANLTIAEFNITFTVQKLKENQHYNGTITASNIAGSTVSYFIINTKLNNVVDMGATSKSIESERLNIIPPLFGVLSLMVLMMVMVIIAVGRLFFCPGSSLMVSHGKKTENRMVVQSGANLDQSASLYFISGNELITRAQEARNCQQSGNFLYSKEERVSQLQHSQRSVNVSANSFEGSFQDNDNHLFTFNESVSHSHPIQEEGVQEEGETEGRNSVLSCKESSYVPKVTSQEQELECASSHVLKLASQGIKQDSECVSKESSHAQEVPSEDYKQELKCASEESSHVLKTTSQDSKQESECVSKESVSNLQVSDHHLATVV